MIPINYEDETIETQTSGVPWGLIGGAVVIIGGAGGAYAYALNQNKKRKAAAALCRPLDIGLPDAGFMALPPAEAVEAPLAEDASVEPVNPPAVGIVPSA